jgi:DNA-binding CsgD family transcriptional regulator
VKIGIFFYMLVTLVIAIIAISSSFLVYRIQPDTRLKRFIRFLVAYSLISAILSTDFFLRNIFIVSYSFVYSLFLKLLLMYTSGLVIFTYVGFILELTSFTLFRVINKILFIVVFLPLYLMIPVINSANGITDLDWVYQISAIELGIMFITTAIILFIQRRKIQDPWRKAVGFLLIFTGVHFPVAILDYRFGGLDYLNSGLPKGFYGSLVLYGVFCLAVVINERKFHFNRPQLPKGTKTGLIPQISDALIEKYGISEREKEIAEAVLAGKTNNEIAVEKFITVSTVKKHISNLFLKTNARNRVELLNILRK